MLELNHTLYEIKHWTCSCIPSLTTNNVFGPNYVYQILIWLNSSWKCHTRPSCCFGRSINCIHLSIHTCSRELPSHLNCLILCTTRFHSLSVNQIQTSPTCKYAIIYESSCMYWIPLLSSSISPSCESLLFIIAWSTSLEHPNMVRMYV